MGCFNVWNCACPFSINKLKLKLEVKNTFNSIVLPPSMIGWRGRGDAFPPFRKITMLHLIYVDGWAGMQQ